MSYCVDRLPNYELPLKVVLAVFKIPLFYILQYILLLFVFFKQQLSSSFIVFFCPPGNYVVAHTCNALKCFRDLLTQVNIAESADDNLLDLLTAYTTYVHVNTLTGCFMQAAIYEVKAAQSCGHFSYKLSQMDLHVVGQFQLVSIFNFYISFK